MIRKNCKNCGKFIWLYPSQIKRGRGKYCSKQCQKDAEKGEYVNCDHCGILFYVDQSRIKDHNSLYCSRKCCHGGTEGKEIVECSQCNKKLERHPWQIKGNENHFCDHKCMAEFRKSDALCLTCDNCGKEFERKGYWVKSDRRRGREKVYCSIRCRHKSIELYPKTKKLRNIIRDRQRVEELHDSYLRNYISQYYNLDHDDISQELVELKRLNIKRKRIIWNHNQKS